MRNYCYFAAAAAALMCASCKSTSALSNQAYTLTELNGTELKKVEATPSISFTGNRVNATVGCNQIFAEYKVEKNGKIAFSMPGMTRMMCHEEMREQEFVVAFNKVAGYQLSADGSEVSFLDAQGKVLFKAKK
ncbi:MAG: META domain-containing protein [Bacteroidales bacterium]|nr:META domain-containing protein [Bacteroidales bacterium]